MPGNGGDWTVVLQFDGGIGMRDRFREALSAASRVVVHTGNGGKPIHLFHGWEENGELRTGFEVATVRTGATPDELVLPMREIGFDPAGDVAEDSLVRKALLLALAERLTGVRATEEFLTRAEYRLGHVPEEPAQEGTSVVIALTDANGEGLRKEVTRARGSSTPWEHHRTRREQPHAIDEP